MAKSSCFAQAYCLITSFIYNLNALGIKINEIHRQWGYKNTVISIVLPAVSQDICS